MIKIKPELQYQSNCPLCTGCLEPMNTLWQGMHVCIESNCVDCAAEIIEELPIGHAFSGKYQVVRKTAEMFGEGTAKIWDGDSLMQSLLNPNPQPVEVTKEVFQYHQRVILLNCIDFLYGHSLLKLLNAQRHLEQHGEYGLIAIVPKFLRWMVPQGVAEIWTVNISLKRGKDYYPAFNQFVLKELERFTEVQVSEAYSHPSQFDVAQFTTVPPHDIKQRQFNVTFVWREDRLWCHPLLFRLLRKLNLLGLGLALQNWKIHRLMRQIKAKVPHANCVVTGLGKRTQFSQWIEDFRVDTFDEDAERKLCKIYADSRLVVGIHGSNMLLPSGHAGMTVDLMPDERWGNFAQDILYQEVDPRLAAYRYRFLPDQMEIQKLADIISIMITKFESYQQWMTAERCI